MSFLSKIIAAIFLLQASLVQADEVFDLINKNICLLNAESALSQLNKLSSTWLDKSSNLSVSQNLDILGREHETYIQKLRNLSEFYKSTPDNIAALGEGLRKIDKYQGDLVEAQTSIFLMESRLSTSIQTIQAALQKNAVEFRNAAIQCPNAANINKTGPAIDQLNDQLDQARAYIALARKQRAALTKATIYAAREDLKKRTATKLQIDLSALEHDLRGVLAADLLYQETLNWFYIATSRQTRVGNAYFYYQYEASLHELRSDIELGKVFYPRIDALGTLPGGVENIIRTRLDANLKSLSDDLAALEKAGWQGQLQQQVSYIDNLKVVSSLSPNCRKNIEGYSQQAAKTKSIDEFRTTEKLFKQLRQSCSTKA